jgi:hypothetical protein
MATPSSLDGSSVSCRPANFVNVVGVVCWFVVGGGGGGGCDDTWFCCVWVCFLSFGCGLWLVWFGFFGVVWLGGVVGFFFVFYRWLIWGGFVFDWVGIFEVV